MNAQETVTSAGEELNEQAIKPLGAFRKSPKLFMAWSRSSTQKKASEQS
jgi:hypothetical protein